MPPRRRRSQARRSGGSVTQSWFSLIAFAIAILLIFLFKQQAGDSAAGCLSSAGGPDAGAADGSTGEQRPE